MANYTYITATGTIVPDTATTRADVVTEFQGIFGDDFITDPESPEGMWIDAETTSRQSVARNNAALANQTNPNLAGGPFLDALWALTGGQRTPATRSTVAATVAGVANTTIPQFSQARTSAGEAFRAVSAIVIPVSGSVTGTAWESVTPGAIPAGANDLTQITDAVLGWETITNPAAATLGRTTESDEQSRNRRRQTLGLQGRSVADAVRANVLNVPGVRSLSFRENVTNAAATIDGIRLVAHSIWVAVDGGADTAIANALLRSKTAGAAWNGAQSVTVTDPVSGQLYTVLFDRPTSQPVLLRITVRGTSAVSDPITAVRNSVLAYVRGEMTGEPGFALGVDVSPFEIAAAVNRDNPALFIPLSEAARDTGGTPTYSTATIPIAINQIATVTEAGIQVLVV